MRDFTKSRTRKCEISQKVELKSVFIHKKSSLKVCLRLKNKDD